MNPNAPAPDPLGPDERAALADNPPAQAVAADLARLGADRPPAPSPEFHANLARKAGELDAPTAIPAAQKGWLARHRWATAAALVAAGVLIAVVALPSVRDPGRGTEVAVNGDGPPPVVWGPLKEGDPGARPIPTTGVQFEHKGADPEFVLGDRKGLSDAQKQFGEWVARMGTLNPKVTINGQPVPLKQKPEDPLLQEEETGWECDGRQFVTKTRRTLVLARQVGETLFGVQNPDIFPGILFDGREYLTSGKVVPARARADRDTFTRQRMTVIGPRLGVEGAIDAKKAGAGALADRKENLLDAGGAKALPTFNPTSRADYDRVRNDLLPMVGAASYYSVEVDTARCKEEFEFKAGLKVSGGFGEVITKFGLEEKQEYGMVFARGVEVAYTVAIDDRERAARWVNKDADVSELVKGDAPLMYCDAVVYGRAWMVVAVSKLTTSEMQAVFNGTINTVWAKLEPDLLAVKKKYLAETNIKVFNIGGAPKVEALTFDLTKMESIPEQIRSLQQPALTPRDAMPIAYRAKWLATDKEAGWVGVVPMRTFTQQTEPVRFDLTLRHYNVRREFGGTGPFGGGGKLNIGTRTVKADGSLAPYDPGRKFYRDLTERNFRDINHPLVVREEVPAAEFGVLVRQAELGGGINTWEGYAERVGDGFGEQKLTINVQELLKPNAEGKVNPVREEVLKFPGHKKHGPNEVTVQVAIHPPKVPPLPPSKPIPDVGARADKKTDEAKKDE